MGKCDSYLHCISLKTFWLHWMEKKNSPSLISQILGSCWSSMGHYRRGLQSIHLRDSMMSHWGSTLRLTVLQRYFKGKWKKRFSGIPWTVMSSQTSIKQQKWPVTFWKSGKSLKLLKENMLRIQKNKYHFWEDNVKYLGFLICKHRIETLAKKIKGIYEISTLINIGVGAILVCVTQGKTTATLRSLSQSFTFMQCVKKKKKI